MTDVKNPFDGLSKKTVQLGDLKDPEGNPLKVIPHVKDAEIFITMKREMDEIDAKRITDIFIKLLKRTYPNVKEEDLKVYVAMNYGELLKEMSIVYGFASRKDFETVKDKFEKKLEGR